MAKEWTKEDILFLRDFYPEHGKTATAREMGRSEASIRAKTSKLGLKLNRQSPFFKDWQSRAANSKIGKKRPEQAEVMKRNYREGKMPEWSDERRQATSDWVKQYFAQSGHPRGMSGKKHTPETLKKLSQISTQRMKDMTQEQRMARNLKISKTRAANNTPIQERPSASWKGGWRTIGGRCKYFRSRWEANYGRYLEWLKSLKQIKEWEHEPETFWFEGVKRGCVSYLPDFRVTNNNGSVEYHEVKGWMDARSKTKIKRMAKYHPTVKLIVIDNKAYKSLCKDVAKVVDDWE